MDCATKFFTCLPKSSALNIEAKSKTLCSLKNTIINCLRGMKPYPNNYHLSKNQNENSFGATKSTKTHFSE
uniref:Uncharacterized protein n=1 Tax=Rhizophora mucronata TaxID=61149 RepID=A0A2P2JD02_RHIMU